MNSNVALKFAVSALAIGATMVACKPAADASRVASASARAPKAEQQAADFHARAQAAVRTGDVAGALGFAERAVELSPRDAGYRMTLADLYLKNGRFQSAETTFSDVRQLDPGNVRASFSIALARIALGRPAGAVAELERIQESASPADIGLAYALAGEPRRAVELLEPAARAPGATGRLRQNLALAYALAGDWQKARITASQDVSPAELGARLQQWAAYAQPGGAAAQVATLLGVTPVEDRGQPVRLALASPEPAPTALAAAEPAGIPEPAPETVPPASVALAEAVPPPVVAPPPEPSALGELPQWVSERAAAESEAPAEVTRPVYADAVQALVTPQPSVLRPAAPSIAPALTRFEAPRRRPARQAQARPGRFAVQLGAYSSAASVERAWAQMLKRFGFEELTPLSTTVTIPGRGTFHRLSVAGFADRGAAGATCRSIRAKGGACFVRTVAGDAPVRWASRYASRRAG